MIKRELIGTGINAAYRRNPFMWMELIINCLTQLQETILTMETMGSEDSEFITKNVLHIKRFYEELEREFFRLASEQDQQVQSNLNIMR